MESKTEILVVGAGPAGLSAGLAASRMGREVVILEREREIGYPVHTSGASSLEAMKTLGIPEKFFNPIYRCVFTSPNETAEFDLSNIPLCVLDVRGTYQYLAMQAARSGCEIKLGSTAKRLIVENNFVKGVHYSQQGKVFELYSNLTIDASGISACFASYIGSFDGWRRYGSGAEYEACVENLEEDTIYLIVGNEIAPTGYAWLFPVGQDRVRIGVGVTRPDSNLSPVELLNRLIERKIFVLKDLGRITPVEFHVGQVPVEGSLRSSVGNGLVLVGDSACQANPILGDGIRQAMCFGRLAGEVAAEVVKSDVSVKMLGAYEKGWRGQIQRGQSIGLKIQKRMTSFDDAAWDRVTGKISILTPKEFIRLLSGDFSEKFILKLIAKHPKLATSLRFALQYL
jgi:digeranylgeranylglycerophospholipid reductase